MRTITITVAELPGGGYVLTSGDGDAREPVKACSRLAEAAGEVFRMVEDAFGGDAADDEPMRMPKVVTANVVRPGFMQRVIGGAK